MGRYCLDCGETAMGGDQFCYYCGEELPSEPTDNTRASGRTDQQCSGCGANVDGDDSYCYRCGTQLQA